MIVKRLPALHHLGAMDVLCLDETGTLTRDRPVVERSFDAVGRTAPEVLHWAALNGLCTLELADLPAPDALDEAVLDAVDEWGAEWSEVRGHDGVAVLPFDPVRHLATAVVRRPCRPGVHILVTKGAVESVLKRCAMDAGERTRLSALAAREAANGLRLLAVARTERSARLGPYTPADERGLTFLGFVTLRDALAPSAADALSVLEHRGVAVKVPTGDHPGTAVRACRDLGVEPGEVVTADRINTLSDTDLARVAGRTTVFARCSPEHKARILSALRTDGYTTGFFGDGVNDLPALHATVHRATVDDVAPLVRLRGLMLTDMGVDTGGPEAVWRAAAGRWFAERLRRPDEFAAFVIDDPALGVVAGATGVCDGRAPSPADPSGLNGMCAT